MNAPFRPDHRLRPLLAQFQIEEETAITPLADLKREIHQYGKRRADVEASRDNLKYYLGFAFEVNGALDLDSLALAGLLSLPWRAFDVFFKDRVSVPDRLIHGLRAILRDPVALAWARAQGAWLQWTRLEAIYRQEVEDFRASDAFNRKDWRRKSITRAQHYLIGEIHRVLGVPIPVLATRGQAFDFIAAHGGNPRFLAPPSVPLRWWQD